MKFNTKKELAERLMDGEKWRVVGHSFYCFYSEIDGGSSPFRCSDGYAMGIRWNFCDSKKEWEQVIDKPKTIKSRFIVVESKRNKW
jgi:hypothetical protein